VFNSDSAQYGGSDQKNSESKIEKECIRIKLAPLATQIFEIANIS
jgi:hypothetical protein